MTDSLDATDYQFVYWKFMDYDEIYRTPEWRFESTVEEIKHWRGIPIWIGTEIKTRQDYDQFHNPSTVTNPESSVASDNQPTKLPKRTRQVKNKQETVQLPVHDDLRDNSDTLMA